MANPFFEIRMKSVGADGAPLSPRDFAFGLDVSQSTINLIERGVIDPPAKLLAALKDRGYDPDHLLLEYNEWREQARSKILAGIAPPD